MDARFNVEAHINKHFFQEFNDGRPAPLLKYDNTVENTVVMYRVRGSYLQHSEIRVLVEDCLRHGFELNIWSEPLHGFGVHSVQTFVSFTPVA